MARVLFHTRVYNDEKYIRIYSCLYFGLKNINHVVNLRIKLSLVALFFLSFVVVGMPDMIQGIYWYNSAWHYIPFFFLTFLNISLVIRYIFAKDSRKKEMLIAGSSILSFLISGGNNVTGFLNILCLLFLLIPAWLKKKRKISISFFVAVLGYILVFIAPGTAIRASLLSQQTVIRTIVKSGIECCRLILEWTDLKWICMFLLCLPFAIWIQKKLKFTCKLNPVIMLCIGATIFCGCLCVPYMAMGNFGDMRVTNVYWIMYYFLSIFVMEYSFLWIFEHFISIRHLVISIKRWQLQLVICILLFGCYFGSTIFNNNFLVTSWEIYNGRAKNFAEQFDERLTTMEDMDSDEILEVTPLPFSRCLRFDDVTSDKEDWRNKAWESYYGKSIITIEENDD